MNFVNPGNYSIAEYAMLYTPTITKKAIMMPFAVCGSIFSLPMIKRPLEETRNQQRAGIR